MVFSFEVECPRDGGRRFETKETRTHRVANAGRSCGGLTIAGSSLRDYLWSCRPVQRLGRSKFAGKHDGEDAGGLLGVRRIFRSVDHLSIVILDLPEKLTAHQR